MGGSLKILTQKRGVFENFYAKKGGLRKFRREFIFIYTLYNDVLSIFYFFGQGGVPENFDPKKGGSLKIFEDPPTDFAGGYT